ncbi:MAG: MBL fold metallo-hydrolase [Thermoanaerobaculia bacterium]|nr:MBL fold metallo-hydrolase [Thermoanaerobaculia bacterium]
MSQLTTGLEHKVTGMRIPTRPAHRFTSHDPSHPPVSPATVFKWGVVDRLLRRRHIADPLPGAPVVAPDIERLRVPTDSPRLTWIGHASFLLQLAGRGIVIDPVMSRRLGVYPRHTPPGLDPEQLPRIDALLISHNHYDHLDVPTLRRLPKDLWVGVPLGLGELVRRLGFLDVHELDWWQSLWLNGLRISFVPARHWSRRGLFDVNRSLWGGWVVESTEHTVYHAGDSAYFDGFAEIGRRFPGIGIAMLPVGSYAPGWFMEHHHMTPEQAGQAFVDLGAETFVPMHWGTFQLTDETLCEPVQRIRAWFERERPAGELRELAVGESLEI